MKKTYIKPMVTFESFAFSSNIAAGCSAVNGIHGDFTSCAAFGTQSTPTQGCTFINGGMIIFNNSNCVEGPEKVEGDLCYDVPTDANRMFMS